MAENKLHNNFIVELFKGILQNDKIHRVCRVYLGKENLQTKFQKVLFTYIMQYYDLNDKMPTLGIMSEKFKEDDDVLNFLVDIKKCKIKGNHDQIIDSLEIFIKRSMFINVYNDIADLYNADRQEDAISLMIEKSNEINNISIKESYYTKVIEDFEKRNNQRKIDALDNKIMDEKCPSGIPQLDLLTQGGFNKGTSVLFLARSGGGKSLILKGIGIENARIGKRVVHFQAEGTEKECLDLYDANWTGTNIYEMEFGAIDEKKYHKIINAQKEILNEKGEIFVYASESFDSMSLNKARTILEDIENTYGKIDMVIFDYLEIFTVEGKYGNTDSSERKRREDIANKMTNIAVEFNVVAVSATQANDIKREDYNNESFVLTRSHVSEFKGVVKPFSYFITINQTDGEYENNQVRLYLDKMRKYKARLTFNIIQSRSQARFCNKKKTREMFSDELEQFQEIEDEE